MSRSWRDRSDYARYRHLRAGILAANRHDNAGRCTLAIPEVCTGTATQVHHVNGKAAGDDPRYMVPACAECNRHVGDPNKGSPQPRKVSNW